MAPPKVPTLVAIVEPELWAELHPRLVELLPKELAQVFYYSPGNPPKEVQQVETSEAEVPSLARPRTAHGLIVLTGQVDFWSALAALGLCPASERRIGRHTAIISLGEHIPRAIVLPETVSAEMVVLTVRLVSKILRLTMRLKRRRRIIKALKLAAYRDPLTGLLNRRGWAKLFPHMFREAQSRGESLVFALFDLDGFKLVDDRLGHARGDQILRQLAEKARTGCRSCDALIRWGGDEFALLFCLGPQGDPQAIVDRVRRQLATPIPDLDGLLLTASAGMSMWKPGPSSGLSPDVERKLFESADTALRNAKRLGGNITFRCDPE